MCEWRKARHTRPSLFWRLDAAAKGWFTRGARALREEDAWPSFKARSDARAAVCATRRPREHRPRPEGSTTGWIERRREQKRLYMRAWRLARRRQPLPNWRSKAAVKGWSRRHWQRLKQETAEYDAWLDFKARSDARAAAWQEKHQRAPNGPTPVSLACHHWRVRLFGKRRAGVLAASPHRSSPDQAPRGPPPTEGRDFSSVINPLLSRIA